MNTLKTLLKQYRNMTPAQKAVLTVLIPVLILGTFYQFSYKKNKSTIAGKYKAAQKIQDSINVITSDLPKSDEQMKKIDALRAECAKLDEEIKWIIQKIPGKNQSTKLIEEMTRLAKDVELVSIKKKIDTSEEFASIYVELRCHASYDAIMRYIQGLETISPFLQINEFKISKQTNQSGNGLPIRIVFKSLLGETSTGMFAAQDVDEYHRLGKDIFIMTLKPEEGKDPRMDFKLGGITYAARVPTAIINGSIVRIGSQIGAYTVTQILPDSVILNDGRKDVTLMVNR